jgi:hypothetical protein
MSTSVCAVCGKSTNRRILTRSIDESRFVALENDFFVGVGLRKMPLLQWHFIEKLPQIEIFHIFFSPRRNCLLRGSIKK